MLAVNLLFSVLLQFAFGHTAASGLDSIGCYKNTIVNSGFIGHVDTYTGGTVSGGDNTPENNKYCADLLAGGYKTGSSFLGNVSPLASINRESTNPQTICGIVVRDKASATLTGGGMLLWMGLMNSRFPVLVLPRYLSMTIHVAKQKLPGCTCTLAQVWKLSPEPRPIPVHSVEEYITLSPWSMCAL